MTRGGSVCGACPVLALLIPRDTQEHSGRMVQSLESSAWSVDTVLLFSLYSSKRGSVPCAALKAEPSLFLRFSFCVLLPRKSKKPIAITGCTYTHSTPREARPEPPAALQSTAFYCYDKRLARSHTIDRHHLNIITGGGRDQTSSLSRFFSFFRVFRPALFGFFFFPSISFVLLIPKVECSSDQEVGSRDSGVIDPATGLLRALCSSVLLRVLLVRAPMAKDFPPTLEPKRWFLSIFLPLSTGAKRGKVLSFLSFKRACLACCSRREVEMTRCLPS